MLTMPAVLCALCWFIASRNRKVWILFPLAALLTGFEATSLHAIGEAAMLRVDGDPSRIRTGWGFPQKSAVFRYSKPPIPTRIPTNRRRRLRSWYAPFDMAPQLYRTEAADEIVLALL
jgi:hypothetical protein